MAVLTEDSKPPLTEDSKPPLTEDSKPPLTDHLPDFFNAYFACFQFVDVIVQQKPDQQEEIFAYLCHAPVLPEVIIALAYKVKEAKNKREAELLWGKIQLSQSNNLNQPPTERKSSTPTEEKKTESPSLPDEEKKATLLVAVTYLQSLTPDEKYQLFISDSEVLKKAIEKITWARFEQEDDQPVTNKGELEKALREKKLHLVHGHTSGDAKGATNLDTSWGKVNDNKKGEYLASVHHTGGEQLTKIEQTLFKCGADLSQHPSKEKEYKDNKPIDQNLLGIVPMAPNDTLELGDMHANALRLIYHLIKHGVFEVNETEYGKMVTLYNEIFDLFNETRTLSDEKKSEIIEKHNRFKTLIDDIKITEKPIKLKLIGDLLADRGVSDILMEWLIIKLHKAQNITLSILASNHDQDYFSRGKQIDYDQRNSQNNALEIRDKDPAEEIKKHEFPESKNRTNDRLTPVQLITTPLEKTLRSPFTWALLSISAAAYPAYDCIQADNKLDSFSTVFDHLTPHGTLTLVLSAAAATCLLITVGLAAYSVYSLCANNNSDPAASGN